MASFYRSPDFRLDGEEYKRNEEDKWGTNSSKIVWGWEKVNTIPYANPSPRMPEGAKREAKK